MYLPQGTDIRRTADILASADATVSAQEGVLNTSGFIGGGGLRFMLTYSPEPRNPAFAQLLVTVDDESRISGLVEQLQHELSEMLPDTSVKVWKFMLGRGGGKIIEAAFTGPDPAELRRLAEEAKHLMLATPSLIAIQDDWRQQVNAIQNTEVFSSVAGTTIPLSQLLESVDVVWQDAMIRRINREATIKVQADPAPGLATSEVFNQIRPQIEAMDLPPDYKLKWYGEYDASKEANEGLALSAPFGFAAMILAVVDACLSRARPVVLGALTTILGVAPLLVDPFFKSMAVTVMFSLTFATALTLVVLPLFYVMVFRIRAA